MAANNKTLVASALGLGLLWVSSGCEDAATSEQQPGLPDDPQQVAGNFEPGTTGGTIAVGGTGGILPPVAGTFVGPVCTADGVTGTAAGGFGGAPAPLALNGAIKAEKAPPPISGGTMLTTRDGALVVASDPDRDQLYVIDARTEKLRFIRQLEAGDEPGRLVEDADGRVHVSLRGAGAIATLAVDEETAPITRREACALPRGLAYDANADLVHLACADGKLLSLGAAPSDGVTRSLDLGADLRDVIVRDSQLFVSRYRSAELLRLGADGAVMSRSVPPTFSQLETRIEQQAGETCAMGSKLIEEDVASTPTLAWRMVDVPRHGVAMLHQRAREAEVQITAGGYGSSSGCAPGITHSAMTFGTETARPLSGDIAFASLAVDVAIDPDGVLMAIAEPGNWGTLGGQVELYKTQELVDSTDFANDKLGGGCLASSVQLPIAEGQATAVTFSTPYVVAVQLREPAGVSFIDVRTNQQRSFLDLKQPTRFDTGHAIFHMRANSGLACASCHGEGGDDAHVWNFHGIGTRRTQQLRGGILGTEPFHWNGDMADFPTLVKEVFVGRMQGAAPSAGQTDALAGWLDRLPQLRKVAADPAAVERGAALFQSEAVGCAKCHSGAHLTNNQTVEVGTGAMLQVPSLHDVALRTPLMHDGCAPTLMDRFTDTTCGGGDQHGKTSQLNTQELSDLVAYVATL
ncbi:MAG: c-type cytochrome [Polyangiales bacterium]